jgi:uncharacterized membrane protein
MNKNDAPATTECSERQQAAMDLLIGYVLLGGVVLSAVLIIAGLVWHWVNTGHLGVEYTIPKMNLFEFVTAEMRDFVGGQFRPRYLVSLGITALLLTPYVRVLTSVLFFAFVAHNWKYSVFTGFVFAMLTYSLFLR